MCSYCFHLSGPLAFPSGLEYDAFATAKRTRNLRIVFTRGDEGQNSRTFAPREFTTLARSPSKGETACAGALPSTPKPFT
jgi:hypothetical protein